MPSPREWWCGQAANHNSSICRHHVPSQVRAGVRNPEAHSHEHYRHARFDRDELRRMAYEYCRVVEHGSSVTCLLEQHKHKHHEHHSKHGTVAVADDDIVQGPRSGGAGEQQRGPGLFSPARRRRDHFELRRERTRSLLRTGGTASDFLDYYNDDEDDDDPRGAAAAEVVEGGEVDPQNGERGRTARRGGSRGLVEKVAAVVQSMVVPR